MITETEIDLLLAAVREAMGEPEEGYCSCGKHHTAQCDLCHSLMNDAPQSKQEMAHADIGALLRQIRATVDDLIAIRVREFGTLLQDEEGELMTIKNSLDWLLSDIRESRPKTRIA